MITYVDTSILLKLLVEEGGSDQAGALWDSAELIASVSLVDVEARAALAAATSAGRLAPQQHRRAKAELELLLAELVIVKVTSSLVGHAVALAEQESLGGYHGLHLAAAIAIDASLIASTNVALVEAAKRHGLQAVSPLQ